MLSKTTCRHWNGTMTTRIQGINKSEEENFSGKADNLQAIFPSGYFMILDIEQEIENSSRRTKKMGFGGGGQEAF